MKPALAHGSPDRRSAIIFGASGAIGGALARELILRGNHAAVYAGARSTRLDMPDCAHPFHFDLADEISIIAATQRFSPPPELVVVATGMLHEALDGIAPEKTLRALDSSAMAQLFAINAVGPALIAKHVLPLLPRDHPAVFAVLSARVGSISDNRLGGWHAYRASKAALNMLMKTFAIEMTRTHPKAIVAALHPGTVDSALSKPFQRGVAPDKLFGAEQSAGYLLDVISKLTPEDSGGFFAWDGARIPY